MEPGVFLKAQKLLKWIPKDLSEIKLYSILLNKQVDFIPEKLPVLRAFRIKLRIFLNTVGSKVLSHL
ncbi:MAG: hypothetical protein OH338_05400 [Candidatus Parvarchaeota archaeon]|nr:hypothetical protein [Candidatus Parvarchaeum tengchongense]MCW1299439.1 hypothetical protein [Candidatus Parvarchaeum tengchongense]MCW1312831.1 hypothetical protein [Candidatus Parvarchaeum tengchongense]